MQQPEYPVYCAWHLAKGEKVVVNTSTVPESHGICPECFDAVVHEMEDGGQP